MSDGASLVAQLAKNLPVMLETACKTGHLSLIPGSGSSLEREMATQSRIRAWKISWTEEPGRLQSIGSQRVCHASVCSSVLCLVTTKIWSDGH